MGELPSHYLRYWNARVSLLELARFLDPGNPEINREWLADRWNEQVYFWRPDANWRAREFWNRWQQLKDWEEHLQHFGVDSIGQIRPSRVNAHDMPRINAQVQGQPGGDSHWINFLLLGPVQMSRLLSEWESTLFRNFPGSLTDTPGEVRAEWAEYWREEALRRLEWIEHNAPDLYDLRLSNDYVRWLRSYAPMKPRFQILKTMWKLSEGFEAPSQTYDLMVYDLTFFFGYWGDFLGLEEFLAAYPGPLVEGAVEEVVTTQAPGQDLWVEYFRSLHERSKRKEEGELPGEMIDISNSDEVLGDLNVTDMHFAFDQLWITGNVGYGLENGRLFSFDPVAGETRVHNEVAIPDYTEFRGIAMQAGDLWIPTVDRGLFRFNPSTNSTQHYTLSDGTPADRLSSVAVARGNEVYLSGAQGQEARLGGFNIESGQWTLVRVPPELDSLFRDIVSNDRYLLALSARRNRYWLLDFANNGWMEATDLFPQPRAMTSRFWYPSADGFWINDQHRFLFLDPEDLRVETVTEFPDRIMGIHHYGDFAWIATGSVENFAESNFHHKREATIHVVYKPSRSLVGHMRVPFYGLVKGMAGDDSNLWIALERATNQHLDQGSIILLDKEEALSEWLANHRRSE